MKKSLSIVVLLLVIVVLLQLIIANHTSMEDSEEDKSFLKQIVISIKRGINRSVRSSGVRDYSIEREGQYPTESYDPHTKSNSLFSENDYFEKE